MQLGFVDETKPVSELTPLELVAAYLKYAADEDKAGYTSELLEYGEGVIDMAENIFRDVTPRYELRQVLCQEYSTSVRGTLRQMPPLLASLWPMIIGLSILIRVIGSSFLSSIVLRSNISASCGCKLFCNICSYILCYTHYPVLSNSLINVFM